jgi:putative membrane protein
MKVWKRGMSLCLVGTLVLTAAVPAYAAETPESSEKEEVVYATLKADGSLDSTYVVNSFAGGEITDYGDYSSVKMLNTDDPIQQQGDEITFSTDEEKVYYQGDLPDAQLPWKISLTYTLDGKEIDPQELAGSSGALKIQFQVTENPQCTGSFYQDYALQATFVLDTEQCKGITAPDATIANVGGDKQLTYTILPGEGIDTQISADVTDFEMNAVSINGIRLNLSVDVDDQEIRDKVSELMDAVDQLDDGAARLSDGSESVKGGTSQVKDGASSLHSGVSELDQGVASLQSGLETVQQGLDTLNSQSSALTSGSEEFRTALQTMQTAVNSLSVTNEDLSQLATASGEIRQAIDDLYNGATALQQNLGVAQYKALLAQNGLDVDSLKAQNDSAVATIQNYESLLEQMSGIPGLSGVVDTYKSQLLGTAEQVKALLNANTAALQGTESYLEEVSAQLPALTEGLGQLKSQYETFDTAITQLVNTLGNMTGNLAVLAGGINQLADRYTALDDGINGYTDGVAQLAAGYGQVMEGVSSLAQGSKELVNGSGDLYDGTVELYDGVTSLCDGAQEMANGTGEFRQEAPNMKEELEGKIDSLMESLGGDQEGTESFVSAKNTQVDSVQFAFQTTAILKEEQESTPAQEEAAPTFWQRLMDLFTDK